jgi:hypothetical protein
MMSMDEPKAKEWVSSGSEAFAAIWRVYMECPSFLVFVGAGTGHHGPVTGFPQPLVVWKLIPAPGCGEEVAFGMTPAEARSLAAHLDKVAEDFEADDVRDPARLSGHMREAADIAEAEAPKLQ